MNEQQINDLIDNATHPLIYRIYDPLKSEWIYSSANLSQRDSKVPYYDLKERRISGQLDLYPELNFEDLSLYPLSFSTYAGFKYFDGQPAFVGDIYRPLVNPKVVCIMQGFNTCNRYQRGYYDSVIDMSHHYKEGNPVYVISGDTIWSPRYGGNEEDKHPTLTKLIYLGNVYQNPDLVPPNNLIDYNHGKWSEG